MADKILCENCTTEYYLKVYEEQKEQEYCPFCGADVFVLDDEEEEFIEPIFADDY